MQKLESTNYNARIINPFHIKQTSMTLSYLIVVNKVYTTEYLHFKITK